MSKEAGDKVFGNYSAYYDLLYRDKDYVSEAGYVDSLLKEAMPEAQSVADFGCGTARHAIELARMGYSVIGVELSETMVSAARENIAKAGMSGAVTLQCCDITTVDTGMKYDAVVALFHVMGYLSDNATFLKGLSSAAKHLKKDGVFIFDFWYGPAVLTELPEVRTKTLKGRGLAIERTAVPEMIFDENVVEVNYTINATDESSGETSCLKEKHRMRYFFLPELRMMLGEFGFEVCAFYDWMTRNRPEKNSWSVVCVSRLTGSQ